MRKILVGAVTVLLVFVLGYVFMSVNTKIDRTTQMDGETEKYYFFGKKTAERHYVNGQLNGETKIFYRNGRVKSKWIFRDGVRHGIGRQYSPEGNLIIEERYSNGKKISQKKYDQKGNVVSEKEFE